MFLAKGHAQKLAEALGDVVGKPVAIEHGDNVVVVRREAGLRDLLQIILDAFTLIGQVLCAMPLLTTLQRLPRRLSDYGAPKGLADR